jgi:hypothetical protein
MATRTVHAHADEPREQTVLTLRKVAAERGWSLAEGESRVDVLVFKKGLSWTTWGTKMTVVLEEEGSASKTKLTFISHYVYAITDWGRGRREVARWLAASGANED